MKYKCPCCENNAKGIIKSFDSKSEANLKSGRYKFNVGAHGEVGSSEKVFFALINMLLGLLEEKEITMYVVKNVFDKAFFKRYIKNN